MCRAHFGDAAARSRKIYLAFPKQEMSDEKDLDIERPDILPRGVAGVATNMETAARKEAGLKAENERSKEDPNRSISGKAWRSEPCRQWGVNSHRSKERGDSCGSRCERTSGHRWSND